MSDRLHDEAWKQMDDLHTLASSSLWLMQICGVFPPLIVNVSL